MEKKAWTILLLDFYGPLLTEHQRQTVELFCGEDYTLSEIAQIQKITRQAVRDTLMRAERTMTQMEEKLKLASRTLLLRKGLEEVCQNLKHSGQTVQAETIESLWRVWESE